MQFTYPRSCRLIAQQDFRHVFDKPLKVTSKSFIVLYRPNALLQSRLGMIITKRHVRRAVDRNQLRRWLRDGFRLCQDKLKGQDIIVLLRSDHHSLDVVIRDEINHLWQRLISTLSVH